MHSYSNRSCCLPLTHISKNLQTSVNTSSTSNNGVQAKNFLANCSSSVSIEQTENCGQYRKERKLFMKYLLTLRKSQQQAQLFEQMKSMYEGRLECKPSEKENHPAQSQLLSKTQTNQEVLHRTILSHFCEIWLNGMGYRTEKNKQMVIERVRMSISDQDIYPALVFYEKLGEGVLDQCGQLDLKLEICRNGWEYFSRRIIADWLHISEKLQAETKQI